MKRLLFICLWAVLSCTAFAQESNKGKKLWAASVLNQKAPQLEVEQWLSKRPDTAGKFTLVDFWATWCGPCRAYIPMLNEFHQKYADRLNVIGISDEPADRVKNFKNPEIRYFEAIDTKGRTKKALQITGIPHIILIDPKGIVRWEGFPLLSNFQFDEKVLLDLMEKYKN